MIKEKPQYAKQRARERGRKTYLGRLHICGSRLRSTDTGDCVWCSKKKPKRPKCVHCQLLHDGDKPLCGTCHRMGVT